MSIKETNDGIEVITYGKTHKVLWLNKKEIDEWLFDMKRSGKLPKKFYASPHHELYDPKRIKQIAVGWVDPVSMDRIHYKFEKV